MNNLYFVQKDYFEKLNALMDMEGITEEIINDTLSYDSEECAKSVGAYYKNNEAQIEKMKKYETDMYSRRKALESKNESLKASLLKNMQLRDIKKIPSDEFDISIKKNRSSVVIESSILIDDLPKDCIKIKVDKTADKEKIREKLESGQSLKGCSLVDTYRVEIK
jgi:hypothetical protein